MMTSDISISRTLPNISGRKLSRPRISVVSLLARATSCPVESCDEGALVEGEQVVVELVAQVVLHRQRGPAVVEATQVGQPEDRERDEHQQQQPRPQRLGRSRRSRRRRWCGRSGAPSPGRRCRGRRRRRRSGRRACASRPGRSAYGSTPVWASWLAGMWRRRTSLVMARAGRRESSCALQNVRAPPTPPLVEEVALATVSKPGEVRACVAAVVGLRFLKDEECGGGGFVVAVPPDVGFRFGVA